MIHDAATQRQVDAANPRVSTWLSANAGSGKTHVLTDRVARLLLADTDPQNILCLTYTKAAAAEMQNRLFQRLGGWAMMPDADLRAQLSALGTEGTIDPPQLRKARTLFARAIETPGGLKIQTIHSFCASVLRRFALEAGVSPQFREMEEREAQALRADVVDAQLEGPQADIVKALLAEFTGSDLHALTGEIAQKRDYFRHAFDPAALHRLLKIPQGLCLDHLVTDVFDRDLLQHLADACAHGTATHVKTAKALQPLLQRPQSAHDIMAGLESVFLTGSGAKSPFTAKISSIPKDADLRAQMGPLLQKVEDNRPLRLGLLAVARTRILYDFARLFIPAYEARKLAMGALDFDDLIGKTRALLTDRDVAQWVLFRLDGGIDHILVDEAQDTSLAQWAVIERLSQEFAAGAGARPNHDRTLFIVGDKKQSIYSFQGADPAAFDRMKTHFQGAHATVDKPFAVTSLDHSFRSAQAILSVVDATFTGDRAQGMDDALSHIAFQENMPGRVDLWPIIPPSEAVETGEWFKPVDAPSATDHTVMMARRIATQIAHMIAHDTLPIKTKKSGTYARRPITEGDFLILVQRRHNLFEEIIRACKARGLKIAGADRLRVGAELAVKDLAAVLQFLALPEDDLSLACALRSPLFNWSEQDLFTLAHHRAEKTFLWQALRRSGHTKTLAVIDDLRGKVDFLRPYDLISRILIRHDGRRKLLARLGPEAEDGIDALLSQALAYESVAVPNLTGFLTWMETDDLEIKRQMERQGDRIRVMTVHGAKGLEAPIVILPETIKRQTRVRDDLLTAGDHVIWKLPVASSSPAVMQLRQAVVEKDMRERMRLLYVAMTRAEKWLIVGAAGDVGEGDDSWYNIVADGLQRCGDYDVLHNDLPIRRFSTLDWDSPPLVHPADQTLAETAAPVFGPLPAMERATTIAPSDLPGAKLLKGEREGDMAEDALARGVLIHLLLEHLPLAPPADRHALGLRLVRGQDASLVDDVIGLIENPALANLWSADALTEVEVTAALPGIGRIHGTIDRLIIGPMHITAIDYKSNRVVPVTADGTPLGLLRQLAVYHTALRQIYPDHDVRAAILWTHTGQLMDLPDDLLHDALNGLTTA